MINRRSLLVGAGALTLSQFLSGCKGSGQNALRLSFLEGSMPIQLFQAFERHIAKQAQLNLDPTPQLAELFKRLQTWKQGEKSKHPIADLVTLGDYWLTAAIQQQLIQPLDMTELSQWQNLPQPWQDLVRRNDQGERDAAGQVWAAPYRWGTLMIVYRVEEFKSLGWVPSDWADLWRPELAQRLSLLDDPRTVIGLVLKKLGRSLNEDLTALTPTDPKFKQLETDLKTLNQQVKFYSSDAYLQPLLVGDTWAAVGWSGDILPMIKNNHHYNAVVPASGTMLWADLWARPAKATSPSTDSNSTNLADASQWAGQWIDFCWQKETALQQTILGSGASPMLTGLDRSELPSSLQANNLLLPDIKHSEFLDPLTVAIAQSYQDLWVTVRQKMG